MKIKRVKPSGFFLNFFRWFCHPQLRQYIEGDLMELYEERCRVYGKQSADIHFIIDVLLLFRPGIIRPMAQFNRLNHYGMFKNYFTVGVRNMLKYKVFSFINVTGLAVAMSVCMLIMLMLADQKSYDQFHVKKDKIYRIISDRENGKVPSATTAFPLARILKNEYPVIEESTCVTRGIGGDVLYNGQHIEMQGYFADASFFDVFSYPLEKGNSDNALLSPNTMVISREYADKLFQDEDPLGKTVMLVDRGSGLGGAPVTWGNFTITGVMADHYKSHLQFNILISASSREALYSANKIEDLSNNWSNWQSYTYVVMAEGKNGDDLAAALNDIIVRRQAELKDIAGYQLMGQALSDITPGILLSNQSSEGFPMVAYYLLSFLAFIIMVSACLNYTNLSTARALTRAKEIGMRKVSGAQRRNLVYQFLSESMISALLALAVALLLLMFLKPAFEGLWINQYLNFDLQGNAVIYLIFIAFALLVGLMAGIYPAFYLSRYQPIKALKSNAVSSGGRLGIRKVLSAAQFIISLLFITTSVLIFQQFKHFLAFDYGFDSKQVVNIALQGNDYRKVSNEFAGVSGVSAVSACDYLPATGTNNTIKLKPRLKTMEFEKLNILLTDENFAGNLDIGLLAGRYLTATDSANRFIVLNEAALKAFGYEYPRDIIGQEFEAEGYRESFEVVGVVEDFCVKMPMGEEKISPMMLQNRPHELRYVNVKIVSSDLAGTLAALNNKWQKIDPVHPLKYEFYDDQLTAMYQALLDIVSIFGFIAFLAITIACLGMLGMAIYTAERRRKEVGIRKVLGAADFKIAVMLSREFLTVLFISVLMGMPLSYFLNNLWLQHLPNRVPFGWGTLLVGSFTLLALGLVTIGSQCLKASRSNPVDSLKTE